MGTNKSITTPEVPTEEAWGNYSEDPDQSYAHDMFYGRTNEEMQKEYRKNITARTTDLKFMPASPFRYYMLGFRDFVLQRKFDELDAPDAAYCFLTLVVDKLKDNPEHIFPLINKLMSAIKYVANNQYDYSSAIEIYGAFQDKLELIEELIERE